MSWIVIPYVGVGDLRFGMSPQEVAEILGAAEEVQGNPIPELASPELHARYHDYTTEFRLGARYEDAKPSVQYRAGKVVSVEVYEQNDTLEVVELLLFKLDKTEVNAGLMARSRHYAVSEDSFIFLDFGVAMSKDDTWEYAPSVNVFARGEFDTHVAEGVAMGTTRVIGAEQ